MGSRPARALWIEIPGNPKDWRVGKSRPARALWIEIPIRVPDHLGLPVEAREGLVD